jgi:ABC-type Mn2+/Zn2+ transport system ATPase subunit
MEDAPNNPVHGTIRLGETSFPIGRKPKHIQIAFVPESIIDSFLCSKVDDEVLLSLLLASPGVSLSELSSTSVLADSPIREKLGARIGELSGGQMLLLAIEAAILAKPHLILVDASLDCLDPVSHDYVQSLIGRYLMTCSNGLVLILSRSSVVLSHVPDVSVQVLPDLGIRRVGAARTVGSDETRDKPREDGATLIQYSRLTGGYRVAGRWTIRSLDFTVAHGICIGITGPNGCGKSTLLKLMSGVLTIKSGDMYFDGRSLRSDIWPGRSNGVAYFSQGGEGALLFSEIESAREGRFGKSTDERLSLCSGERFSHAVEEAMQDQPALWLFDEPTGHVESSEFMRVLDQVRLRRRDASVIVVSHNSDLMAKLCDQCYELVQEDVTRLVPLDRVVQ